MLKDTDKWLKLERISCGTCEWEEARECCLCNSFRELTACCIRCQELKAYRNSEVRLSSFIRPNTRRGCCRPRWDKELYSLYKSQTSWRTL